MYDSAKICPLETENCKLRTEGIHFDPGNAKSIPKISSAYGDLILGFLGNPSTIVGCKPLLTSSIPLYFLLVSSSRVMPVVLCRLSAWSGVFSAALHSAIRSVHLYCSSIFFVEFLHYGFLLKLRCFENESTFDSLVGCS